jgi:hypothetical protein
MFSQSEIGGERNQSLTRHNRSLPLRLFDGDAPKVSRRFTSSQVTPGKGRIPMLN